MIVKKLSSLSLLGYQMDMQEAQCEVVKTSQLNKKYIAKL